MFRRFFFAFSLICKWVFKFVFKQSLIEVECFPHWWFSLQLPVLSIQALIHFSLLFQVFRAPSGRTLSVHFRSIAGSDFEVNVTDKSTPAMTLLSKINASHIGKVVKTVSTSILEMSVFSKSSARIPLSLDFIIMSDEGMASLSVNHKVYKPTAHALFGIIDVC